MSVLAKGELPAVDQDVIDEFADKVVQRRMTSVSIFFLESMKPLRFVAGQMLLFFQPIVQIIWQEPLKYEQFVAFLERPDSVERLIQAIERAFERNRRRNARDKIDTEVDGDR